MISDRYYYSPHKDLWQGRADSPPDSFFFQCVQLCDVRDLTSSTQLDRSFVLLGFACDEGIVRNLGRQGAAEGPDVLRVALAKCAIYRAGVGIFDAGNIACFDHDLEAAQQALAQGVYAILQAGGVPIVVGGGHELAWGHYQGMLRQYPKKNLGIVNLDAHLDMRPLLSESKGSSGSPFLQIANAHEQTGNRFDYTCIGIQPASHSKQLIETAQRHGVNMIHAEEVFLHNESIKKMITEVVDRNENVYLSLCLDVFCSAVAPGVSAPQSLGLMPWQVVPMVRQLAQSGKVIGYDLAELSPPLDSDNRTAKLAAQFIYEVIHFHHFRSA